MIIPGGANWTEVEGYLSCFFPLRLLGPRVLGRGLRWGMRYRMSGEGSGGCWMTICLWWKCAGEELDGGGGRYLGNCGKRGEEGLLGRLDICCTHRLGKSIKNRE